MALTPEGRLRDYVAWFMTGERLEERLQGSDGRLVAINVEWNGPPDGGGAQGVQAAVELRFSNGMTTAPWYVIDGLTSADIEAVAAELSSSAGWQGENSNREKICLLYTSPSPRD